ncbi:MAG: response regulator transcription factor [Alphaproteobacteria bacterium]|nr:response regulator transcription factor [Alphaproteobacteria bacterium]
MNPVYIIDDDRDVRESIAFLLDASAMRCLPFADGREFAEQLDELEPGCVLLDLRMPRMNGLELLEELDRRACRWPVIVMSGHGEQELAAEAIGRGAIDFIEKPFDVDLLLARLRESRQEAVEA